MNTSTIKKNGDFNLLIFIVKKKFKNEKKILAKIFFPKIQIFFYFYSN